MEGSVQDVDSANTGIVFPKPHTPTPTPPPSPPTLPLPVEPPPPYPSRDRRSRAGTIRSRRAAQLSGDSAGGASSLTVDPDTLSPEDGIDETTPLLPARRRTRTASHSTAVSSESQSLAHTVFSLFQTEADADATPNISDPAPGIPFSRRMRRYFRPLWKASYYGPLFHLLVLNFPYALVAFLYLFVGTLTGTTLLIALPLGAVLCWFNLIGARAFARGELALQRRFHKPLPIEPSNPPNPIFSRPLELSADQMMESGQSEQRNQTSFLRNTYAMFTDPTSYQAIFYFLVIKPSLTLLISLALVLIVPVSFALILPAPAMLRAVKRAGIWQATIAVEGLSRPRL